MDKKKLLPVGGFQSGFSAQIISRVECKYPDFLICNHNCEKVVQLISHVSGEPELELCFVEAEKMANVLLKAIAKEKK